MSIYLVSLILILQIEDMKWCWNQCESSILVMLMECWVYVGLNLLKFIHLMSRKCFYSLICIKLFTELCWKHLRMLPREIWYRIIDKSIAIGSMSINSVFHWSFITDTGFTHSTHGRTNCCCIFVVSICTATASQVIIKFRRKFDRLVNVAFQRGTDQSIQFIAICIRFYLATIPKHECVFCWKFDVSACFQLLTAKKFGQKFNWLS